MSLLSVKPKAPISKHLCRLQIQIQVPCHPLGWQGVRFGHGTAITCRRPGTDLCFAGNSSGAMPCHKTAGFKKKPKQVFKKKKQKTSLIKSTFIVLRTEHLNDKRGLPHFPDAISAAQAKSPLQPFLFSALLQYKYVYNGTLQFYALSLAARK